MEIFLLMIINLPIRIILFLKNSKSKIVCFVPDLIKNLNLKMVKLSNIIIGFSKALIGQINFIKQKI